MTGLPRQVLPRRVERDSLRPCGLAQDATAALVARLGPRIERALRQALPGMGTMSDSSYSRTAPKPLHPGQAPRGLLNENRIGVSAGAAVPQFEQVGWAEKRRRSPLSSATATPSPSLKAVATASASRPRVASEAGRRSTTTRTSCASRTCCSASGGSSRATTPSSWARTNPAARSCAATSTSGRCALAGRGKVTKISGRGTRTSELGAGDQFRVPRSTFPRPARPPPLGQCRLSRRSRTSRSAGCRCVPRGAAGSRRSLWPCRPSSGCWSWGSFCSMATAGEIPSIAVDQRFRHPLEELLGIRGERLDVAALALGVQGIERQRALAGPRRSGDHREGAPRQLDGDALRLCLPRVADDHAVGCVRHNHLR